MPNRAGQQFHQDPQTYQSLIAEAVPHYAALQEAAIDAIPFEPSTVLELGVGAGETAARLIARYPGARHLGVDTSPGMAEEARARGVDARVGDMKDELPDGPWDLVISVLAVHHLPDDAKQDLFERVRRSARSFVLGDVVLVEPQTVDLEPGVDLPARAIDQAHWCDGVIAWEKGDFAVICADYR